MRYPILIFAAILFACNPPVPEDATEPIVDRYAHIEDAKARAIIQASIAHAGGLEKWESIKKLNYTKDFSLLLESGEMEKAYHQLHDYSWYPLKIDIKSTENGALIHTVFENGTYARTQDGKAVDISQEALVKSVNTSTYVVSLPFKLLDPGPEIIYEGETTLSDGQTVDVLKVSYNADENANHSTSDVWKYYFDKEDAKIVANWVKSIDHFSLIENLSYERAGGILFNKDRKSYRVDSLGNKLFLRAEYSYGDYVVEF